MSLNGGGGGDVVCFLFLGLSILLSLGQLSLPSLNPFGDSNIKFHPTVYAV